MAIDVATERLLTLSQAAAMLPGRPSLCALWRWRTRGVRGRKLETVVIGGRPYTSVEALGRFARHEGGSDAQQIRTPKRRQRDIEAAERELTEAGV
jgi:hypothetical protein